MMSAALFRHRFVPIVRVIPHGVVPLVRVIPHLLRLMLPVSHKSCRSTCLRTQYQIWFASQRTQSPGSPWKTTNANQYRKYCDRFLASIDLNRDHARPFSHEPDLATCAYTAPSDTLHCISQPADRLATDLSRCLMTVPRTRLKTKTLASYGVSTRLQYSVSGKASWTMLKTDGWL